MAVIRMAGALAAAVVVAAPLRAQGGGRNAPARADSAVTLAHDSVSVRLVDADLRAAVEALAPYLDRPVVFGSSVPGARVTITTPHPVPREGVRQLLEGILASQNLELASDSGLYRIEPKATQKPPAAPTATHGPGAPAGSDVVQLFIIHLRHARAADVAATVNALYGRASALGELGGGEQPATLGQQLQANQVPPSGVKAVPSAVTAPGRDATLTGDVTIVPDPRTNSLLIRATPHDYQLIDAAVRELDTRPLEVLIEVIIAEVRRDRNFSFGVSTMLPTSHVNGSKTTVDAQQTGAGLTDFVMRVMHLGSANIDATLTAGAERGDVHILSRPVVIAANNQVATINVGTQRPFVQVSRSLPTDQASRDQVVQYKDVGTRLTVQPTISPDGYVVLQVTQEVNNATNEIAFDAPVISTRSVQTELLIKDGQTVALGGLTDRQRESNQGGVPILSAIPLLGGLFGHASRQSTETELFIFLTPHVIHTDADADSLTGPLLKRAERANP